MDIKASFCHDNWATDWTLLAGKPRRNQRKRSEKANQLSLCFRSRPHEITMNGLELELEPEQHQLAQLPSISTNEFRFRFRFRFQFQFEKTPQRVQTHFLMDCSSVAICALLTGCRPPKREAITFTCSAGQSWQEPITVFYQARSDQPNRARRRKAKRTRRHKY